jgi:hypothetical protein
MSEFVPATSHEGPSSTVAKDPKGMNGGTAGAWKPGGPNPDPRVKK